MYFKVNNKLLFIVFFAYLSTCAMTKQLIVSPTPLSFIDKRSKTHAMLFTVPSGRMIDCMNEIPISSTENDSLPEPLRPENQTKININFLAKTEVTFSQKFNQTFVEGFLYYHTPEKQENIINQLSGNLAQDGVLYISGICDNKTTEKIENSLKTAWINTVKNKAKPPTKPPTFLHPIKKSNIKQMLAQTDLALATQELKEVTYTFNSKKEFIYFFKDLITALPDFSGLSSSSVALAASIAAQEYFNCSKNMSKIELPLSVVVAQGVKKRSK